MLKNELKTQFYLFPLEKNAEIMWKSPLALAIMLAIATKSSFIKKRYALAEAKHAFSLHTQIPWALSLL